MSSFTCSRTTSFKGRGNDLVCQVPASFVQAAVGTQVEVPTLDQPEKLIIPKGTQPYEIFRLKSKGFRDCVDSVGETK